MSFFFFFFFFVSSLGAKPNSLNLSCTVSFGPRCEKTGPWGFRPG